MLLFDVVVLIVDGIKSSALVGGAKASAYLTWILMNFALGLVCIGAHPRPPGCPEATVAFGVFLLALLRTFFDYVLGYKFLFP